MTSKKMLLCGASGFIGRNLLERFQSRPDFEIEAVYHTKPITGVEENSHLKFTQADLRNPEEVERLVNGKDIVIQAAATTSGAGDIVERPYLHVTDNAVMNSLLLRACFEIKVSQVVFFSCTVMYPSNSRPVSENDFNGRISEKYFAAGWTKVYLEKMCEFYSRISKTQFTVIRHSNIYGPHDKFDLERSHVFGATAAKVLEAPENGTLTVWGDGSEERDLLYVGDLVDFVETALRQNSNFELVNVGLGKSISVRDLVKKIIQASGKSLTVNFDKTKPSIPFNLKLNIDRAKSVFGWAPKTSLEEGIHKTLAWYRSQQQIGAGLGGRSSKTAPSPYGTLIQ